MRSLRRRISKKSFDLRNRNHFRVQNKNGRWQYYEIIAK